MIVAIMVLNACTTHTESRICAAPLHCPCDIYRDFLPMHGSVREIGNSRVLVEVMETWGPAGDLVIGDHVGGTSDGMAMCGSVPYEPAVGHDVFALYQRGEEDRYPLCVEYKACAEVCGPVPWEDAGGTDEELAAWDQCDERCIRDTRDACILRRPDALRHGSIAIAAWDDIVYLGNGSGGEINLPLTNIELLGSGGGCRDALPAGEPEPIICNDTMAFTD